MRGNASGVKSEGFNRAGLTPCGRATVIALQLNNVISVMVRREWVSGSGYLLAGTRHGICSELGSSPIRGSAIISAQINVRKP